MTRFHSGTPSGKPLCRSCFWAHYRIGRSETQTLLYCGATMFADDGKPLPFEMYECNDYKASQVELNEMKKIAWDIFPREGGKVGFKPPEKPEVEEV